MKRTALKRRTPLKRKTRLRQKSLKNSYRRRERDFEFMQKVRKLGCIVRYWADLAPLGMKELNARSFAFEPEMSLAITTCYGRVQADHGGERAKGKKAHDRTCVPMCRKHHGERTDYRGTFKNWNAIAMRAWCDWAIRFTTDGVAIMGYR